MVKGTLRRRLLFFVSLGALSLAAVPAPAQVTGSLVAMVMAPPAQPAPNVPVKLLLAGSPNTRQEVTDQAGLARFTDLEGGVYTATVTLDGYSPVTCPGVRIVGSNRQVVIHLNPAGDERPSSCKLAEAN
jgi:hypothetical protein